MMEHILRKKKKKVEKKPRSKQQQKHSQICISLIDYLQITDSNMPWGYMILLRLSPTNTAGKLINL